MTPDASSGPAPTPRSAHAAQLRIGDEERGATARQLIYHHAEGRLTLAELDDRMAMTWAARTSTDLAVVMSDLPLPRSTPQRGLSRADVIGLRVHAAAYVLVVAGLWLVWAMTGTGHPWPIYPMLGWGLGLLGHWAGARACSTDPTT